MWIDWTISICWVGLLICTRVGLFWVGNINGTNFPDTDWLQPKLPPWYRKRKDGGKSCKKDNCEIKLKIYRYMILTEKKMGKVTVKTTVKSKEKWKKAPHRTRLKTSSKQSSCDIISLKFPKPIQITFNTISLTLSGKKTLWYHQKWKISSDRKEDGTSFRQDSCAIVWQKKDWKGSRQSSGMVAWRLDVWLVGWEGKVQPSQKCIVRTK